MSFPAIYQNHLRTCLSLISKSCRLIMTTWSQLLHLILISAPIRVTSQRLAFFPVDLMTQAWGFFISTKLPTWYMGFPSLVFWIHYTTKEASLARPLWFTYPFVRTGVISWVKSSSVSLGTNVKGRTAEIKLMVTFSLLSALRASMR